MEPKTIHSSAVGPYRAPRMGPKIGPRPAILSSCTRYTVGVDMGTKSTPSFLAIAGVGRCGLMPKIRSMIFP
jgi:hypothetical protein